MNNNFNKSFEKDKNLKISEEVHSKLTNLKKQFRFSTFDSLILYLLNEKKSDIEQYFEMKIKENVLIKIENNINDRIDSIQKRLSKFGTLYFDKIIDLYNLHEASTIDILKGINEKYQKENTSSANISKDDIEIEKIKIENRKLLQDSLNNDTIVQNLEEKIRLIKSRFELKSGAFSKSYEAKISISDFEDIFK
ncbi:hypothetical protein D1631_00100 [Chryseobacterium nematophagum]|uniref:Uncharacterized protein n=1 Tax=Chryseobacterium nematophagum TaxID=2305228 RepID=A0A3M7TLW3_9FLAO|nr:hypothetical protein [Chryseobacterium nematophagum]RNA63947.1 hypothetical protein D1631_00100 [Chryseobacterium nematophagum]